MKYIAALLLPTFLTLTSIESHEFYVSITEMQVRGDTLQLAIKVFTHDLEEVIKDETGEAIFLDNTHDMERSFRTIKQYCSKHLLISHPGKACDLSWVGHEYEADVTWIYAYTILDDDSSLLLVRNTLLTTSQRNQHNMVHMVKETETVSKICTAADPEVRFSL